MVLPIDAKRVGEIAPGIALYDVSHLLPKHDWKKWHRRNPKKIKRLYIHHSGADHPDRHGFDALKDSAFYSVAHLEWPGTAYQFWASRFADRTLHRELVLYQANRLHFRTWHTGFLANGHGISLALEGNTSKQGLTHDQREILEAFIPYARKFGIRLPKGLSGHWEACRFGGKCKKSCPGDAAKAWVTAYREGWA